MKRTAFLTLAIGMVLGIAAPSLAQESGSPQVIQLQDFGGRLRSVKLKVNGREGIFTIDTGGGVSLISPAFAKRIGCEPWGAHTGFRLTGERLDLPRCDNIRFTLPNGKDLTAVSAGVLDLQPLLFENAPAVDGSIALDAFEDEAFSLDLGNGTLTLLDPETVSKTNVGVEIPIRLVRQAGGHALAVMVPSDTAKGSLWMMLDSGGGAAVLLRDRIAIEAGVDPKAVGAQPYELALAGTTPVKLQTRAIVRDMILDGVIGMPVLVRWNLTFDLAHDRLWIRPLR